MVFNLRVHADSRAEGMVLGSKKRVVSRQPWRWRWKRVVKVFWGCGMTRGSGARIWRWGRELWGLAGWASAP